MFSNIHDLILGYDIAFVYAGKSYTSYVEKLANLLSKNNIRSLVYPIEENEHKHSSNKTEINKSSILVVFATEETIHSVFAERLIENFKTNKKKIICIDMGFAKSGQWYYLLKNQTTIEEKQGFIANSNVSEPVFDIVAEATGFRVKNKLLKKANVWSFVLAFFSILVAIAAFTFLYLMSNELMENKKAIEDSRKKVQQEKAIADQAQITSDQKQKEAIYFDLLAEVTSTAVKSNNSYLSDPTAAIILAQSAYRQLEIDKDSIPSSVNNALLNSFYYGYDHQLIFYQHSQRFSSPVNTFHNIPSVNKILVAQGNGMISTLNLDGQVENSFHASSQPILYVHFGSNNQTILASTKDSTYLFSINGGLLQTLASEEDEVIQVAEASNEEIVASTSSSILTIWDKEGNKLLNMEDENGGINYLTFSPVEPKLALAIGNKVTILNRKGEKLLEMNGHDDDVIHLSYSINGSRIVSSSYDHNAIIWSKSGEQIKRLSGHAATVNAAAFSPDRTHVITASDDQTAKLWSWDGKFIKTLAGHFQAVTQVGFSPNSLRMLTVSLDNTVKIWDKNGNLEHTLKGHSGQITKAQFSNDGRFVITSSKDGTIKKWPVAQPMIQSLNIHSQGVKQSFFTKGNQIASLSGRGVMRMWDREGNVLEQDYLTKESIRYIYPTQNDSYLIAGENIASFNYNGDNKIVYKKFLGKYSKAILSHDENRIAAIGLNGQVELFNKLNDTIQLVADSLEEINDIVFDSNNQIVFAGSKGLGQYSNSGVQWLEPAFNQIYKLINCAQDHLLALEREKITLLDSEFKVLSEFRVPYGLFRSAIMNKSLSLLYAGNDKGDVYVFDESGRLMATLAVHKEGINWLSLSENEKILLTSSNDNSVKLCPLVEGIDEWLNNSTITTGN